MSLFRIGFSVLFAAWTVFLIGWSAATGKIDALVVCALWMLVLGVGHAGGFDFREKKE